MTPDAHPVAAHCRLAPDAVPRPRPVDEEPPATRIPAAPQAVTLLRESQRGGQQVVGDRIPAVRGRPQRSIGPQAVVHSLELPVERRAPLVSVEPGIVGERADRVAKRTQPSKLAIGRRRARVGDGVRGQELHGARRRIEMVVWRFAVPGASTVMGARSMEAVRQTERRIRPELPGNGVHLL